jgi:hypothetical protein
MLVLFAAVALGRDLAPPKIPVAARDPGPVPSPYEARVQVPALSGTTSSLNLTALAHEITRFTVATDCSAIGRITAANEDAILHHLAADARWRLVEEGGAIVAYQRVADGKEWTVAPHGYVTTKGSIARTALRFGAWDASSPWAASPLVSRARAEDSSIEMTAFNLDGHPGWKAVALAWEGPIGALEIFDAGTDENLPEAASSLSIVPPFVSGLVQDEGIIRQRGYDGLYMASKEPRQGEPTLDITSPAPGELEVRARIHTPSAGATWVRLDDGDLHPWEEVAVATGTREIIGWSDVPQELFYLQGRFPVPSGAAFSGTAEVWFQSKSGGDPVLLGAFPIKVPKR